jgi:hypothetical protein
MCIRKGIKLLEEREGQGDIVQRQHEYVLAIRLALKKGEVLVPAPIELPDESKSETA